MVLNVCKHLAIEAINDKKDIVGFKWDLRLEET